MDFVLPLPGIKNGNSGILIVVCKLSKMIRIVQIKSNITVPQVATKLKERIHWNRGLPLKVISDRDSLFMNKF